MSAGPDDHAEPLLSVLIPTRNRVATLVSTVANVLEHGGADLEVVVHDTSDARGAQAVLASRFGDERRLRYAYTPPPLSFADTFDATAALARGTFVTIIGDDDGITSSLAPATAMAADRGWDAIVPTLPASYNWPDFRHAYYADADAGRLGLRDFSGTITRLDPAAELMSSARRAFQNFDRLPRIYYGIVRRTRLEEVRAAAGTCFFGSSPDISGAVALAQFVRTLVRVDYPLFLPGSSARSGAGLSGMKKHSGNLAETPQTAAFAATWPSQVPPVYAVQTVWAQAALAALGEVDTTGAARVLDVGRLHAETLVHNPAFARVIIASLASNLRRSPRRAPRLLLGFVAGGVREVIIRGRGLFYRVARRGYYSYSYTRPDLGDVQVAVNDLERELAARQESFDRVSAGSNARGA